MGPHLEPFQSSGRAARRAVIHVLSAACFAAVGFASSLCAAGESHADASAVTKAEACSLATRLARMDVGHDRVTGSHCECLENKDDRGAPWSCTAFVSHR